MVFEQTAETGPRFTQLHIAASPILALLNKPNYSALLGFVQGNLTEVSSFQSAKDTADAPKLQRFTFNPEFKFGPPAGDMPTFRMTADLPEVAVSMFCRIRHKDSLLCRVKCSTLYIVCLHPKADDCGIGRSAALSEASAPDGAVMASFWQESRWNAHASLDA